MGELELDDKPASARNIIVDNLHVTLAGVVFSEVEKRVAADIVQQTVGVLTFRNNLAIESETKG